MRVALTLPQFRNDTGPALDAATAAEEAGLDGVFVFDHLWAIGRPGGPALPAFPLLAAIGTRTARVTVGTLVARIGLVPDEVLVHQMRSVHALVGDRLVAGLGTGDRLSVAENLAYHIDYPPAAVRRARVGQVSDRLRGLGITTWIGGRAEATRLVALRHADALNLWDVGPGVVAAERRAPVTWGGQIPAEPDAAAALLASLAAAEATWAVCAPPYPAGGDAAAAVDALAEAVRVCKRAGGSVSAG